MKNRKTEWRFTTGVMSSLFTIALAFSSVWPAQTARADYNVTCESQNNNRNYCRTNTSGGVYLQTQLSKSSCHRGSTWGTDSRGIWVSNGCRAVFHVGTSNSYNESHSDSDKAAAAVAGIALLAAGAAIAHEKHEERERDRHGDDYYSYQPSEYDRHYYGGRGRHQTITCESLNNNYNYCRANIYNSHVRMVRRHSNSGCEFHRDWGYDGRGIWVENGCRATFEIE